jgi:hypothetical protein
MWGAIMAALTLLGTALAIQSLVRFPRWRQKAKTMPAWRRLLGITGALLPAVVLAGLPSLITATSDRAFSYAQLFRSMPGLMIWLGLGALLGVINSTLRVLHLAKGARNR